MQGTPVNVHAGELTPQVIAEITGVVIGYVTFIAKAVKPRPMYQAVNAVLFSAITLGIWEYANYAYSRAGLFDIFSAFGIILLAAYGAFTAIDPVGASAQLNAVTGGKLGVPLLAPVTLTGVVPPPNPPAGG